MFIALGDKFGLLSKFRYEKVVKLSQLLNSSMGRACKMWSGTAVLASCLNTFTLAELFAYFGILHQ